MKEEIHQILEEDKQKNELGVLQEKEQLNKQNNSETVVPPKRVIIEDEIFWKIESQIKNGHFKSKEELMNRILELKKQNQILNNTRIEQLLNIYDQLNVSKASPLDLEKYKKANFEDKNLMISKEDNRVLSTLKDSDEFENEFKQTQNEISADKQDGIVNADEVFKHMATHQKEEIILMSLEDASLRNDIEVEVLNKIMFFVTHIKEDLRLFKVDIKSGMFYNSETAEVYEVRKNEKTNEYEIFIENEKVYTTEEEEKDEEIVKEEENNLEMRHELEQTLNRPKALVRKKETSPPMGNAAFTKTSFLIASIILFGVLVTALILLNK